MSPLLPPWDVYLPVALVLGGLLALAWLAGRHTNPDPVPALHGPISGRPVGFRLSYIGGPADGWILTLPERPGISELLGGRYEPQDPEPDGRVRMVFAGFVATGRGVAS